MRKFDYSFLNNGLLPANLVNLTSNIAALKTMAGVRKDEYTQIFTELEAVAKVQSIKSSNAIEGIVTSDERIAATRHLAFLQIHLIPAPVSSWHRGFSYKGVTHGNYTAHALARWQRAYCRNRNRRNH